MDIKSQLESWHPKLKGKDDYGDVEFFMKKKIQY